MKMIIAGIAEVLLLMLLVMFIGLICGVSWCEMLTICGVVLGGFIIVLLVTVMIVIISVWGNS